MNIRIDELAAKVGISVEYLANTKQLVLLEEFARLIVKECTLEVNDYINDVGGIICSLPEHVLQDRFDK